MKKAHARLPNHDLSPEDADTLYAAESILAKRINARPVTETMTDPLIAGKVLRLRLAAHTREIFSVMFLDTRHRIIAIEDLFFGTIDGAEIHPREVVKRALIHNAAAVIVAHNHPSGNAEPSAADRAITIRLKQALGLVDIRLLDHFVVVVGENPLSMAARGWV